jgi:hypothetical protein
MPTETAMPSSSNPYQKFLADRNPQEVIAVTPQRLTEIFQQLGSQGVERSYAPGKWSARQILCHLADCEIAFGFRLRQALAEPHHTIQPFDQELWAKPYAAFDAQAALGVFSAVRHWNLALLKTVSPDDYAKPVIHPERGTMTFETIVQTMAGHDLNHLRQLESIAAPPGDQQRPE